MSIAKQLSEMLLEGQMWPKWPKWPMRYRSVDSVLRTHSMSPSETK
ncbi:hypothetical protein J2X34_001720 [Rhodococcus sp. BE178]